MNESFIHIIIITHIVIVSTFIFIFFYFFYFLFCQLFFRIFNMSFPVPILFIESKLFYDTHCHTTHDIFNRIDLDISNIDTIETNENNAAILAIWEMLRVTTIVSRQTTPITDLYRTWCDLGYTPQQKHIWIFSRSQQTIFNAKISMLFRTECFGIWAMCPLDIWNIAKERSDM